MTGRVEDLEPDLAEPDLAALGQLDRRHRRRDLEWRPQRLRVGQPLAIERVDRDVGAGVGGHRGVVADVIPVAMGRDDELERPAALGQLVRDPGERRDRRVDRDGLAARSSAMSWTFVAIGPTVRVRIRIDP